MNNEKKERLQKYTMSEVILLYYLQRTMHYHVPVKKEKAGL